MKITKIKKDGSIMLPKEFLKFFPSMSELAIWSKGDTIVLKRLTPLKPSAFAKRAPENEMPLEEIAEEIHKMRREKKRTNA